MRRFTTGRDGLVTVHDGLQTVREGWRANEATGRFSAWTGRGQPAPKSGPPKRARQREQGGVVDRDPSMPRNAP